MNISSVSNLLPNLAQLQGTGNRKTAGPAGPGQPFSIAQRINSGDISPLAQFLSRLQQIQQQNPVRFKQVAENVATRLQKAAQNAQSSGNTAHASELNQLAAEFQNSAQTGQLPSIQDLQQVLGGHHGSHPLGNVLASVLGTAAQAI
jgi:hypothetical protein